jgi:hypothetical protein
MLTTMPTVLTQVIYSVVPSIIVHCEVTPNAIGWLTIMSVVVLTVMLSNVPVIVVDVWDIAVCETVYVPATPAVRNDIVPDTVPNKLNAAPL